MQLEITELEELYPELKITFHIKNPREYEHLPQNYVTIKAEIASGGMLRSISGDGNTPDEALTDLAKAVSNTTVVTGAYTNGRKEFKLPTIVHTKLLKPEPSLDQLLEELERIENLILRTEEGKGAFIARELQKLAEDEYKPVKP